MSAKRAEIAAKRARMFGPGGKRKEEPAAAAGEKKEPKFKIGDKVIVAASPGEYKAAWNGITGQVDYVSSFKAGEPYTYIVQLDAFVVHADKRGMHFSESELEEVGSKRARLEKKESESTASASSAVAAAASSEPPKNERLAEIIEDYLTCSICKKPMSHSVALPCSHMFCRYCINQWFYAWPKKCPECRKVHARATTTQVPHMDRLISAAVCVSPESTKEHEERLKAADAEYAELQEQIKKDRSEKEDRDSKDAEEALKGSSSEDEEDEDFSDQGSGESDGEEEEEEEEEPQDTRRSSRNAKPAAAAAAAASTRATRGQKRK